MDQGPIVRRDLELTGLSCAACVSRVERVLGRLPGVASVSVNLATGRAALDTGPGFEPGTALDALERAGYPAGQRTVLLRIEGLQCAACVARVERALGRIPGVTAASVDQATARARVTTAAGLADAAVLERAIAAAGYRARRIDPDRVGEDADRTAPDRDGLAALLALALAAPLLLPMALMPAGIDAALPPWWQMALAAAVQLGFGARFYRGAFLAARAGAGSMDTLVALGSSAAFGLSLWDLLAGPPGAPLYFEASAAVIALVRLGKWLERRASRQAGDATRALHRLRPDTATLRENGVDRRVPVSALAPGALLLVGPGERIAADAIVREGVGRCDESLLTGEAMPVEKRPGSRLVGGALNGDAPLLAEIEAVGERSRLAGLVRSIEQAQASKPPVQRLVDRVSAVFVPVVLVIAALVFAGWALAGIGIAGALLRAVSVLVVACPCALGLATPAAIAAGIGVAARHGILIRDVGALEGAGRLRFLAFDKTGTLTEGRPALLAVHPAPGQDRDAILRLAALLQHGSEHPLARAVLDAAGPDVGGAVAAASAETAGLRGIAGRGVRAELDGRTLWMGNAALMREAGAESGALSGAAAALEAQGRTVSFLAETGAVLGLFGFGDRVRPEAARAVAALRRRGLRLLLLTGDGGGAADAVARAVGIDEVVARASPEQKAERIRALRALGPVAMVGDGVNDAPALAGADLSMAMATGADVALAACGIALMRGDLGLVPAALDIAARTLRRIRLGLFWAFCYNLLGIPLAAAGLLSPALAGAAMACSSVLVVGNALLLLRWRPREMAAARSYRQ